MDAVAANFSQTTEQTQIQFSEDRVLCQPLFEGQHPNAALLARIVAIQNRQAANIENARAIMRTYQPLMEIVNQYVDESGVPRPAMADAQNPAAIARRDDYACYGRCCGFDETCFAGCSLGPTHRAPSGAPLGTIGTAPIRGNDNSVQGPEIQGVLVTAPAGEPAKLRSSSCVVMTLFSKVFAIPPAPTSAIGDQLFLQVPGALAHVEAQLAAPASQATAPAPSAQPVAGAAAPPPPPAAPAAGTAPPPPPPAAAAPAAPAAPAATQPAATPQPSPAVEQGFPYERQFEDTTLEQEIELRALMIALEHSPEKPKSADSIVKMIDRNRAKGFRKCCNALRTAAVDRGLCNGKGVSAKLKQEVWPKSLLIPQGYFEGAVTDTPVETMPAASAEPTAPSQPEAPPSPPTEQAAPPQAPEPQMDVEVTEAGTVAIALTPGAQDEPTQRIDVDETAQPAMTVDATSPPPDQPAIAVPEQPATQTGVETPVAMSMQVCQMDAASLAVLKEFADAANNLAAAMRAGHARGDDVTAPSHPATQPESGEGTELPTATKRKPAKKKAAKKKAGKKPAKKKPAKKKPAKKKAAKKKAPAGAPKPHPSNPKVQKKPSDWQPGKRGRPPAGVKKNRKGEYVLPRGWAIIKKKWHPPMPK